MARRMELLVGGLIGGAALVLFGKLRRRRWQSAAASKLPVDPSQCSMCYSCSAITNGPSVGHSNDPFAFTKRENYIQWHDYFMSIAVLSSFRSKDPNRQVGACIVNPSTMRIVAMGYNGFPHGCNDDALPWARTAPTPLETKYPYVCHAEMNAILNKNCESLEGCRIYVTLFPCNECAKLIIQSRISEVVFFSDKAKGQTAELMAASHRMFKLAGVKTWRYEPKVAKIVIIN